MTYKRMTLLTQDPATTTGSTGSPVTDYTTGTPWPAIDLEGVVTEDMEVSLKDNFVLAVNKDRILALEIPEGYSSGGTTMDLIMQNVEDTKKMFLGSAPTEHDAKLAYDLFWLMMDWDGRNAQGIRPLKGMTDKVEAIDSIDALNAYFLDTPPEKQLSAPWVYGPEEDFKDSSHYVLAIGPGELLLKDSAEYSNLTDYGKIKKDAVTELAKKMLIKLGYSEKDAEKKIENCFAFETLIAAKTPSSEQQNSPDFLASIYNIHGYEEVKKAQGKIPVLQKMEKDGFPKAETFLVMIPDYLPMLDELYTQENLPLIKDYMIVSAVVEHAGDLDRECYEWNIAYKNALSGASGMLPDEDIFSPLVAKKLKWPVGRLFAETYLRQEDKDRITEMIRKIIEEYHGIINDADFLSDTTKAKAIEKLDALGIGVFYPDSWEKYECPELNFSSKDEGGSLWQALEAIVAYDLTKSIREYGKPVDKEEWPITPNTVNCGYLRSNNSVYIMGAFAQGQMYNSNMTDEEVLGRLGWVMGHEISHAFDANGGQIDKYGNMNSWWTEEDYAAFLARNEKMVEYYNNMHPWEGQDFHGKIMTGEGCADMGGMKAVLRIAAKSKDFDYDTFFRSLALVWLEKCTLQAAYYQIEDVHPMGYLRVNCTLQQYDEFLDFYGITEGDGMYLAPEDRVNIW